MPGRMLLLVLAIFIKLIGGETIENTSVSLETTDILTVYPTSQTVVENDYVVIDCIERENGEVVWKRGDGTPLPKRAHQIGGRLKISKVRQEDGGWYICFNRNENSKQKFYAQSYLHVLSEIITTYGPTIPEPKTIPSTESGLVVNSSPSFTSEAPTFTIVKYTTSAPSFESCTGCKNETAENLFECADGQKISKSLVCNRFNNCPDGSDESNCRSWSPKITLLPKAKVELYCGDEGATRVEDLVLECQFVGNPVPLIKWKKYEGHVPSKCQQISTNGRGVLTCPNFQQSDQGAYSCVAENSAGSSESQPKSVAKCSNTIGCSGFRVTTEEQIEHCLECYCSGKSKNCQNIKSNITFTKIPFPETKTELFANDNGDIQFIPTEVKLSPSDEVRKSSKEITYCSLSKEELKEISFLKSFGRNINIPRYLGKINFLPNAPDLIIQGNNISLMYTFNMISHYARAVDVRFWPGNWHHLNKTAARRHDLMKVLSNVDAMFFRCEYQEGKSEGWANNSTISLESSIITDYTKIVSYVEKCSCPRGYDGLSCELCASGFVRKNHGDDFTCEQEVPKVCKPGWTGKNCDTCDISKGYYSSGNDCIKNSCNPKGSVNPHGDSKGKCQCKESVTGETCDKCKDGFFHLDQRNGGCLKCWCNGATNQCNSSSLYRTTISSTSLGGYNSSNGRNFWLLPSVFSGNRLTSYGGYLNYSMKYVSNIEKQTSLLSVELMTTDEVTLSYVHSVADKSTNKNEKTWYVRLVETNWNKVDKSAVSRGEFLTVLSKLKAIYVESPYHLSSGLVNLTSAWMSSASKVADGGTELALEVEECKCPAGYTGLSCEKCTKGFYKTRKGNAILCVECNCDNCDPEKGCQDCPQGTYRSNSPKEVKAICNKCPCNGNEKDCTKDDLGQIFCRCKKGFTGMYCQNKVPPITNKSQLKVTISPSRVKGKKVGTKITFNCSYDSSEEMKISVVKNYNKGSQDFTKNIYDSGDKLSIGNQYGSMKNFEIVLDDGLENVECLVHNMEEKEVGRVMSVIENLVTEVEPVKITNCYEETVHVKENENKDLICEVTGNPKPSVSWYRTKGEGMAEEVDTTDGVHSTGPLTLRENGTIYSCIAENSEGDRAICTTVLIVRKACETVNIIPKSVRVIEGSNIELKCKTTASGGMRWSRTNGFLPFFRHTESNGNLNITNARVEDSGTYMCKAKGESGDINKTVSVIVEEKKIPPTVSIRNNDAKLKEGDNFVVACIASGTPHPVVTWKKAGKSNGLAVNVRVDDTTLVINNATSENAGLYECEAKSSVGKAVGHILIEVEEHKVVPKVEIRSAWTTPPVEGSKAVFHCHVLEGVPPPTIQWLRQIKNEKVQYSKDGVLEFQNVSRYDAGTYLCLAQNSAGTHEELMELEVLVPPTVEVSETEVVAHNNDEITVKCSATGYPRPKLMWIKGTLNKRKRNIRENEILTDLESPEIAITLKASYDLQELTCVAENIAGKANKTVTIKVLYAGESGHPDTLELVQLGSHFELNCDFPYAYKKLKWEKVNGHLQGDECPIPNGLMIPSVQIQHNGTYICRPENATAVKKIILIVVGFVPRFTQNPKSYLILPAKLNSFNEIRIEISFKTNAGNGLLILKQHKTLLGLYIKNGKVILRLHSHKVKSLDIKSNIHLKIGVWYSLVAVVSESLIDMTVYDEGSAILERKTERLKDFKVDFGPNFRTDFYLGGAPSNDVTFEHRSFLTHIPSLDGCISRLIIDRHEFDIVKEGSYSTNANLCKRCTEEFDPCAGEGKCFEAPTQYGFLCTCPSGRENKETKKCPLSCVGRGCETQLDLCKLINPCRRNDIHECINRISSLECDCAFGYSGTTCEKVEQYSFCVKGDGYVRLPSSFLRREFLLQPEVIKMSFTLNKPDGLLLWQGNTKDYLSISVYRRQVEYIYFNQGIILKIIADHQLPLNENLVMEVRRVNETAYLDVGSHSYKGSAKFTTNRVVGDIYLGHAPNGSALYANHHGLSGCIHYISFGGHSKVNLHENALEKFNIVTPSQSDVSYESEGSVEVENAVEYE